MAYTVKLGTFSKLENSTAQPVTTGWAEYNVTLKGGADLFDPTLTLSEDSQNLIGKNYAVMMNRYYFITGITALRNDLCEVQLKLDSLATFKSQIGAASLYVLRSASAFNRAIKDDYYPPMASMLYTTEIEQNFSEFTYDNGYYIINVLGTKTAGTTTLYELTPDNFRQLIMELYTDIDGWQLSDIIQKTVQKFGGNPTNLLTSAMYFPISFASAGATDVPVEIGGWKSMTSLGKRINNPIKPLGGFNPAVAAHPQAAIRGDYLSIAPYTKYELYIPSIGIVNLDTTQLRGVQRIYVTRQVDAITGKMAVLVETDSNPIHYLASFEGQIGVPINLKGDSGGGNALTASMSALGAILAAPTGGAAILGAAAAGVGSIASSIGSAMSNASTRGSIVNLLKPMRLDSTYFYVPNEDNTHMGRPLCELRTINTLSGYIKVSEGDVALPAPLPIQQEVKAFLEGGFFYE